MSGSSIGLKIAKWEHLNLFSLPFLNIFSNFCYKDFRSYNLNYCSSSHVFLIFFISFVIWDKICQKSLWSVWVGPDKDRSLFYMNNLVMKFPRKLIQIFFGENFRAEIEFIEVWKKPQPLRPVQCTHEATVVAATHSMQHHSWGRVRFPFRDLTFRRWTFGYRDYLAPEVFF